MSILKEAAKKLVGDDIQQLEAEVEASNETIEYMQESVRQLELALQEQGWQRITQEGEKEFTREGLRNINAMARVYWLKNPLIKRAVLTQSQYVMGQGVSIEAEDPVVNEVVQDFINDPKNRQELTEHQALMQKESELQLFSNFFFTFFVNKTTGQTRVRMVDPDEIEDIIYNPEDDREPWYYKRVYTAKVPDFNSGNYRHEKRVEYYPDWNLQNPRATIGGKPVKRDAYIYHVAVNRLQGMKFGVSEIYAACDWARAYKEFLENWASIVKALQRFAWKRKTKGTKKQVKEAAKKASTTMGQNQGMLENNPAPTAGATAFMNQNEELEPVKTQGATVRAEDGRHLKLMVSAATGIYEHYFGDPSTGNLATAKSMERPMELMFKDRQSLWKSILKEILHFVIKQHVKAPQGKLSGRINKDQDGYEFVELGNDEEGEQRSQAVNVEFPDILAKDVESRVDAVIKAATHNGMQVHERYDLKTITKMLLEAMGEDDIDEKLKQILPEAAEEEEERQAAGQGEGQESARQIFNDAIRELRDQVKELAEMNAEDQGQNQGGNGRHV